MWPLYSSTVPTALERILFRIPARLFLSQPLPHSAVSYFHPITFDLELTTPRLLADPHHHSSKPLSSAASLAHRSLRALFSRSFPGAVWLGLAMLPWRCVRWWAVALLAS